MLSKLTTGLKVKIPYAGTKLEGYVLTVYPTASTVACFDGTVKCVANNDIEIQ